MIKPLRFGTLMLGVACSLMLQPMAQRARPQNAQQILDRMAQAMGAEQAARIRTVQITGTIVYPAQGLQGRFEAYYKSPNKFFTKITLQGVGELLQGYDGKIGWEKTPIKGLRELKGAELEQIRQGVQFGVGNDLRKQIRNPKMVGQAKVGDRNAFVIGARFVTGGAVKAYIDTQRYLLLRMDMEVATPQGRLNVSSYFEDYRRIDGIMYPFTTRQSTAGVEAVQKLERVRHDVPIDDALFRKPKS
jgi:hypothetical protein